MYEIENIPISPNERDQLVEKAKEGLASKRFNNVNEAWRALVSEDDVYRETKRRYLYRKLRGK